jgi:colicin import membrane protein/protein TonB
MEKQVQRERWGDPNGDPEGDSDEGTEGERYQALLQRALHSNYQLPTTIPDKERLYLKSVVILWIDPDGHISRWKVEKPSGNPAFDDALERAIRKTNAPPPPDSQRDTYQTRGVQVTFTAADSI